MYSFKVFALEFAGLSAASHSGLVRHDMGEQRHLMGVAHRLYQLLPENWRDGDEYMPVLSVPPRCCLPLFVPSLTAGETRASSSARDGARERETRSEKDECISFSFCVGCTRFQQLCACNRLVVFGDLVVIYLHMYISLSPHLSPFPRPSLLISPCARVSFSLWLSHHPRKSWQWWGERSRDTAPTHISVVFLIPPPSFPPLSLLRACSYSTLPSFPTASRGIRSDNTGKNAKKKSWEQ